MLNSNFREESPGPSGSVSPFNTSGMKRPKIGRWNVVSTASLKYFLLTSDPQRYAWTYTICGYQLSLRLNAQLPKWRIDMNKQRGIWRYVFWLEFFLFLSFYLFTEEHKTETETRRGGWSRGGNGRSRNWFIQLASWVRIYL